jgi:ribosomal protein L16/L10AE
LARQTAARARTLLRRAAHAIVRRRAQRTQQQDNKEDRSGRGMGEATNTVVRRVRLHRNLWLAKTDPGFAWWRN